MGDIYRRTARAILLDGEQVVLFKRTRPGADPYWITPGGGIEADDADDEAALRRELMEELGAEVGAVRPVLVLADRRERGLGLHHFFLAGFTSMDPALRTGPEFSDTSRGTYDVERVPLTAEGVGSLSLWPPGLADYLTANAEGLIALLRIM